MIDKALMIIIFMYSAGFALVGVQFMLADPFGIELQAYKCDEDTGECKFIPIKSAIVGWIQQDNINTVTSNIVSANYTANSTFFDKIETFTTGAAFVAWELVTLMTGTYIFYILSLFGVPTIFTVVFITLYVLLLARAIIGYVRGI